MSEPAALTAPYPREHETDVVIRDGSTVHVRPIRADDGPAIRVFLEAVSADSIAFRFFGTPNLDWVVSWSLDVDYADRFALIAESGTPSRIVAHAAYIRIDDVRAEVAFLVADAWQGRGISTIMLAHLAAIAARRGIVTFTAQVLPVNHRMIEVFRQSGFSIDTRSTRDATRSAVSRSVNGRRRSRPFEAFSPPNRSLSSARPAGAERSAARSWPTWSRVGSQGPSTRSTIAPTSSNRLRPTAHWATSRRRWSSQLWSCRPSTSSAWRGSAQRSVSARCW
jgi:RimJ/RimL family protein N-acetyltransferase